MPSVIVALALVTIGFVLVKTQRPQPRHRG
jgi:hypothetical protein